jgi:hypothetical protein
MVIVGQYQEPPDYTCTCGLSAATAVPEEEESAA